MRSHTYVLILTTRAFIRLWPCMSLVTKVGCHTFQHCMRGHMPLIFRYMYLITFYLGFNRFPWLRRIGLQRHNPADWLQPKTVMQHPNRGFDGVDRMLTWKVLIQNSRLYAASQLKLLRTPPTGTNVASSPPRQRPKSKSLFLRRRIIRGNLTSLWPLRPPLDPTWVGCFVLIFPCLDPLFLFPSFNPTSTISYASPLHPYVIRCCSHLCFFPTATAANSWY